MIKSRLSELKKWYLLSKKRTAYQSKIQKIYKISEKSKIYADMDIYGYKNRWSILDSNINETWYKTYTNISGKESHDYVPEDLYYGIIEPILNNNNFATAYADKNFYNKYYSETDVFPETLLRNIHGDFYDSDYHNIEDLSKFEKYFGFEQKLVIKPSIDSWGGKNIQIFYRKNKNFYNNAGEQLTIKYLLDNYKQDFVIQKYIESDKYFQYLNPTSLNTIRMYTYRSVKTNKVVVFNSIVRIGGVDSEVDNVSSGGVCCLVNHNGELSDYALDIYGNKFYTLPSKPSVKFSDIRKVPKYNEIKALTSKTASENNYQRLLGFDCCIDNEGNVKIVEINNRRIDINCFQLFGLPLFGEYTDEVIEYCNQKRLEGYLYSL